MSDWETPGGGQGDQGTVARMAGTLAHDVNNVLTIIAGNLALAERHAAGNPKLIRLLNNIRAAAERGSGLTRDLLALSPDSVVEGESGPEFSEGTQESRILVVEDDPQVAEFATTVLEEMGHVVEWRGDAPAALALLQSGSSFDLVFSDIVMPGGMSGIDLAETILDSFPSLPVLLATGYSTAALAPNASRFPMLPKPYGVKELTRRIRQMLPIMEQPRPGWG